MASATVATSTVVDKKEKTSKEEKRARKEARKLKKASKAAEKQQEEAPQEDDAQEDTPAETTAHEADHRSRSRSTSPAPSSTKPRKRKTSPSDDEAELEIDLSLPEPLSKKAARAAKKAKTTPTTTTSKDADKDKVKDPDAKSPRSPHGIWIGNLPWGLTKPGLRLFLSDKGGIAAEHITRVHMPPPADSKAPAAGGVGGPVKKVKPLNRGFAYVDFAEKEDVEKAIALSETLLEGRRVLIKDAGSFQGRPEEHVAAAAAAAGGKGAGAGAAGGAVKGGKPPNKRIFVGNLAFDVTREDLAELFRPCGEVEMVHVATFEDTGKCKGYAWVTFAELDAVVAAQRGWVKKVEEDSDDEAEEDEDEKMGDEEESEEDGGVKLEAKEKAKKGAKKLKTRKWFVIRLRGRTLRCEFAEDAETRYKKRFGKGAAKGDRESDQTLDTSTDAQAEMGDGDEQKQRKTNTNGVGNESRKTAYASRPQKKRFDARTVAPGAALSKAQRGSAAIVSGQGTRTTFD